MAKVLMTGASSFSGLWIAEALAAATGGRLTMVATADAFDDEMRARIRRHQDERDARRG